MKLGEENLYIRSSWAMNLLNSPGRQGRFVANASITANSVTQSAKAVHELDVGAVGSI
jgi:hypothetical protein